MLSSGFEPSKHLRRSTWDLQSNLTLHPPLREHSIQVTGDYQIFKSSRPIDPSTSIEFLDLTAFKNYQLDFKPIQDLSIHPTTSCQPSSILTSSYLNTYVVVLTSIQHKPFTLNTQINRFIQVSLLSTHIYLSIRILPIYPTTSPPSSVHPKFKSSKPLYHPQTIYPFERALAQLIHHHLCPTLWVLLRLTPDSKLWTVMMSTPSTSILSLFQSCSPASKISKIGQLDRRLSKISSNHSNLDPHQSPQLNRDSMNRLVIKIEDLWNRVDAIEKKTDDLINRIWKILQLTLLPPLPTLFELLLRSWAQPRTLILPAFKSPPSINRLPPVPKNKIK